MAKRVKIYRDSNGTPRVPLKRTMSKPKTWDSPADYLYTTADGRFQVSKIWCGGTVWQAEALDGSRPFRSRWGDHKVYNGDSLDDCRIEIAMLYDDEED